MSSLKANIDKCLKLAAESAATELLQIGMREGASDLHLTPKKEYAEIAARVRGALTRITTVDLETYKRLVFAMKRQANVNPVSKKPQDGRIVAKNSEGLEVSMRFASVHCKIFKQDKITIRIPGSDVNLLQLQNLDFTPDDLQRFKTVLEKNCGMVLVTGPTGSGKTTTLYAALNYVKELECANILTAEDPAESPIDGVTQIEPDAEAGNFSDILRSFLRHDPDIIMIGETRDAETAEISVKAALTGHLVLTTLHANTALLSITRMLDLGVDPFNLVFTVGGLQNQRLLRTLCTKCRKKEPPSEFEKSLFRKYNREVPEYVYHHGTEDCDEPGCIGGITGRKAVYELMTFDVEDQGYLFKCIKEAKSLETEYLKYYKAKYPNYKTLFEMALDYATQGIVDPNDILKFI